MVLTFLSSNPKSIQADRKIFNEIACYNYTMASCPFCRAEVQEGEKFCGQCGRKIAISKFLTDENKYWKWGSMIASIAILIIGWFAGSNNVYYDYRFVFFGWLIAFPVIIYLMYIERTKKLKYAFAWISLVIVLIFIDGLRPYNYNPILLPVLFSPAIALDAIYIFKTK